ncbi:MAG: hypothetical protein WCI77_07585 [Candidatus Omnitrophota bacterium]
MKVLAVICFICGVWTVAVFADTLYLKNGKRVDGTILEQAETSIQISVSGVPVVYGLKEIDRIQKDTVPVVQTSFVGKMEELNAALKEIVDAKLFIDNKEVRSAFKGDTDRWLKVMAYYTATKNTLEDLKKKLALIIPPPEGSRIYELLRLAIDYRISACTQAINLLRKDDFGITDEEYVSYIRKSRALWFEVAQNLKKLKQEQVIP